MHPVALLRAPTSAIGGSSNQYVSRQAGLSRFFGFPNGNQSLQIPARTKLKPLRISYRVGFKDHERSDGIEPITVNKSLDNLTKLYSTNSCEQQSEDRSVYKPIEKLIADDSISIDAINVEGMQIDPLDENLRREIVKYGAFVQASYNAMDFDNAAVFVRRIRLDDQKNHLVRKLPGLEGET